MSWKLVGPKIPAWVWKSHIQRPLGFVDGQLQWGPAPADGPFWEAFDADRLPPGARSLLLLHGTGQRTVPGFRGLDPDDLAQLRAIYGDRIVAFEHRAIGHRVVRNAHELIRDLSRTGARLELDVLGLSRGGLIGRYLTEGWGGWIPGAERVRIHKLIFIGTPNDGTPSARRDPSSDGSKHMHSWRNDVRRLTFTTHPDRTARLVEAPLSLARLERGPALVGWPMLLGSQDMIPDSVLLRRLNGFAGPPPGPPQDTRYYGVASIFTFEHGAPDVHIAGVRRSEITHHALMAAPNDLVVPTASVFAPDLGPHGPRRRFPLALDRLMVLGPAYNATHTSIILLKVVRQRIIDWLRD
jgi:hypothetical protein